MDARTRGADPVVTSDRDLSLPLVDDRTGALWAGIDASERDRHVWPTLTDALSEAGRKALWTSLREAITETPDDPERALMVVEAFWRNPRHLIAGTVAENAADRRRRLDRLGAAA
jgi:hypothetical protein